jgi:membrane protein YdbS with pleckstrin-like domain
VTQDQRLLGATIGILIIALAVQLWKHSPFWTVTAIVLIVVVVVRIVVPLWRRRGGG